MASAVLQPLDIYSFLAWEERQELKHEFDGLVAVAMVGGTAAHSIIQGNIAAAMIARLRGAPCRFYGSDLKIQVAGSIRYPDGFVCCTRLPPNTKIVTDPVVIFEVLSESTARTDLGAKNREYEATPSVRRYIILEQDAVAGTQFERVGDDWVGHILRENAILRMPEIGLEVPLVEFYDGIEISSPSAGETANQ